MQVYSRGRSAPSCYKNFRVPAAASEALAFGIEVNVLPRCAAVCGSGSEWIQPSKVTTVQYLHKFTLSHIVTPPEKIARSANLQRRLRGVK